MHDCTYIVSRAMWSCILISRAITGWTWIHPSWPRDCDTFLDWSRRSETVVAASSLKRDQSKRTSQAYPLLHWRTFGTVRGEELTVWRYLTWTAHQGPVSASRHPPPCRHRPCVETRHAPASLRQHRLAWWHAVTYTNACIHTQSRRTTKEIVWVIIQYKMTQFQRRKWSYS